MGDQGVGDTETVRMDLLNNDTETVEMDLLNNDREI